LLASSIGERSDLGLMIGRYGDIQQGLGLAEEGLRIANIQQPDWRVIALAAMIRLHFLNGDAQNARKISGGELLGLISIPLPRYTVLISLANIELVLAEGDSARALTMCSALLTDLSRVAQVCIPEVLRCKAAILASVGRVEDAQHDLTQAASLAEKMGSKCNLWAIYASLAANHAMLGQRDEASLYRQKARPIIEQIANSLGMVGLREVFLNQSGVKSVME
jgi:hypothetical protein